MQNINGHSVYAFRSWADKGFKNKLVDKTRIAAT